MAVDEAIQAPSSRVDDMQSLLEHVLRAPSSFNLQHCRFVLIAERARLAALSAAFDNGGLAHSGRLLVIASDIDAWRRIDAFVTHLPPALQAGAIEKTNRVYAEKERVQRDEAFRSSGLAAATLIQLAEAEHLSLRMLDCTDPDALARAICLPPGHAIGHCFEVGAGPLPVPALRWPTPCSLLHTDRYPRPSE